MRADPAELVHAGETRQDHVVADHHVAGQRRIVREHRVIADDAVVRHVHVGHDPVVVADPRRAAAFVRAAVQSDELADQVAIADDQLAALAAELLVLRNRADRGELEDAVVAPDPRRALDHDVRSDRSAVADFDVGADHAVRADADAGADPCCRIDDRVRMDHPLATSAHSSSASAATLPSTSAWHQNRLMLRIVRLCATSSVS